MTKEQAIDMLKNFVMPLWPNWHTNKEQFKVWTRSLQAFDYDTAKTAVEQHYATPKGQYKEPKLFAIIEKARVISSRCNYQKKKQSVDYEPSVFIQCVENDNPRRVYMFFGIYPPVRFYDDQEYILKAAESSRKKCESTYGGRWIIVQKTTHAQMLEKKSQF